MKTIILTRLSDNGASTIGKLTFNNLTFATIEDTHRDEKIFGKTRIPAGTYEIKLRNFGGHYEKYKKTIPGHEGMLWLQDVPNFNDILIHIGNTAKDTKGCILVGEYVYDMNTITRSKDAYKKLYFEVLREIKNGEQIFIKIKDN